MWSQVEITYAHINGGDFAAADTACAQLMSLFSDQQSLPKEVYQLAEAYNKANRGDKAVELCRYIVERWPSSDHALWAQRDLTIRSIDADDELSAQAAVDKLLSDFSKHKGISQVIHAVAQHYERVKGNLEKALELHRYNVEHFSSDIYAMWSQVELVYSHIRDGNEAGADEAFGKLLTLFAEQPTLPKEIYQVGDEYAKALRYDKAELLYRYVIANWPGGEYEMWARTGIIKLDIYLGNDANVQPALDELIADFNDQPALPEAVFVVGEQYYNQAFSDMNEGLSAEAANNFQKTVAVWEKIIQQLPASAAYTPRFYYITAVVYSQELSQYTKGIEHYQSIVDDWPDYEFAWHAQYFIGMYYERLLKSGGIEESDALQKIEQSYIAVVENYPDSKSAPHAALDLGRINFNREQWIEAAYYFELFLQKSDNNQVLRYTVSPLGQAYEKMGETDSAAQLYVEFIETADPNDPLIKTISSRLAELTWTQN
jgi:tetratricopeptide (TPR) repeat protein